MIEIYLLGIAVMLLGLHAFWIFVKIKNLTTRVDWLAEDIYVHSGKLNEIHKKLYPNQYTGSISVLKQIDKQ